MVRRNELGRRKRHGGTGTVILLILLFASVPLLAARRHGARVEVWMAGGLVGAHGPPAKTGRFSGLPEEGVESGLRSLRPLARGGGDDPCP